MLDKHVLWGLESSLGRFSFVVLAVAVVTHFRCCRRCCRCGCRCYRRCHCCSPMLWPLQLPLPLLPAIALDVGRQGPQAQQLCFLPRYLGNGLVSTTPFTIQEPDRTAAWLLHIYPGCSHSAAFFYPAPSFSQRPRRGRATESRGGKLSGAHHTATLRSLGLKS